MVPKSLSTSIIARSHQGQPWVVPCAVKQPVAMWMLSFLKGQKSWINAHSLVEHRVLVRISSSRLSPSWILCPVPLPELLTAPESSSVPPCLCACGVCILPQLPCSEDVWKLRVEISQLLLPPAWVGWASPRMCLPQWQKSHCWVITVLFLLLCTLAISSSRAGTGYLGSPAQHCM